jgi:hypothetical protein
MAKRFTDTDKWKREWFCGLDHKAKIVWIYLLDQCDHRGVWFRNFKLMSDQLGFKVTGDNLDAWFGGKLRHFDDDKYFIPSFVEFQYGELNPENNAHKSVIALVQMIEKLAPQEPLNRATLGAQDKDMDKDTDKGSRIIIPKSISLRAEIEAIYKTLYPLKKGKTKGLEAIVKGWKKDEDTVDDFRGAVLRYAASVTDPQYTKHFSTFANEWRDWKDVDAGTTTLKIKNYESEREVDHDAEIAEGWSA